MLRMDQVHVIRHKVLVEGQSGRAVARQLGVSRNTVRKYLEMSAPVRRQSRARARPGVVAIPLEAKSDAEITLLANLITLTPGSVSLDVSSDRRFLYLYAMYVDDLEQYRADVKASFERRVLEVLR